MASNGIGWTLALSVAAAAAHAAPGDEQDLALAFGDSAVVSIATGAPQPLRRAPAVATVITAEDIRAMGAVDMEDVLERIPGVHVVRNSALYNPLITMRGIHSQYAPQVLVLQNGQPTTTLLRSDRGTRGFRGWPLESIARIEIIRGPGSALYGADAVAGVINIITRSARELASGEVGVRAGSFRGRDGWAQTGVRLGELELGAWLRVGRDAGFRTVVEVDAQTANDAAFGGRASLAPGRLSVGRELIDVGAEAARGRWKLRANYQWREFESGIGVAQALDPVARERTKRLLADLSWTEPQLSADWGSGATLAFQSYAQLIPVAFMIAPPGARFPTGVFPDGMQGAPETWERQWRASAWLGYTGWRGHAWRAGVGYDDLDMYRTGERKNFAFAANGLPIPLPAFTDHSDTDPFLRPHRRTVKYAYLQDTWSFAPDWQLTAGVRHDRFSDVGGTTNPRVAVVWDAAYDLTAKLLVGRAFRAPGFAELHSITNPVARGNPSLRPETIHSDEFALTWQPRRNLQLDASLFRYRMRDIIRTVVNQTPGTGTTFANAGNQRGRGIELEARWEPLHELRLQASFSYARGRDEGTGAAPGYTPDRRIHLLADWRFAPQWTASGQFNHVAGRRRAPGDARAPVADYTNVDLFLRWSPTAQPVSLALGLRNAFDADVREPSLAPGRIAGDLPGLPRSVAVEAGWRF